MVQAVLDWVLLDQGAPPFRWVVALVRAAGGADAIRDRLWLPAIAIVVVTAGNGAASYLAGRWSALGAERAARQLRNTLYDHIHAVSVAYHQRSSSGDLLQRCTSDVDTVRKFFAIQLMEVGRAAAMVAVAIPVMAQLNGRLTLVAVALLPVAFWYTLHFFRNVQIAFTRLRRGGGRSVGAPPGTPRRAAGRSCLCPGAGGVPSFYRPATPPHRDVTMRLIYLLARYWAVSSWIVIVQLGAVLVVGTTFAAGGTPHGGGTPRFPHAGTDAAVADPTDGYGAGRPR